MTPQKWVKFPTDWIRERRGLEGLAWTAGQGAGNLAALMTLIVIAHHADQESGHAKLTYDQLGACTTLSRSKISSGLKILGEKGILEREPSGRSTFQLADFNPRRGWGKLPAQQLYSGGYVSFFNGLTLRSPAELHAMKLFLLFVAFRQNDSNLAYISYDKIELYTGIDRHRIKSGLGVLAANGLVYVEHLPASGAGLSNAYRIAHIDPNRHMGTMGRGLDTMAMMDTFRPVGPREEQF